MLTASGKLASAADIFIAFALGATTVNLGRGYLPLVVFKLVNVIQTNVRPVFVLRINDCVRVLILPRNPFVCIISELNSIEN